MACMRAHRCVLIRFKMTLDASVELIQGHLIARAKSYASSSCLCNLAICHAAWHAHFCTDASTLHLNRYKAETETNLELCRSLLRIIGNLAKPSVPLCLLQLCKCECAEVSHMAMLVSHQCAGKEHHYADVSQPKQCKASNVKLI